MKRTTGAEATALSIAARVSCESKRIWRGVRRACAIGLASVREDGRVAARKAYAIVSGVNTSERIERRTLEKAVRENNIVGGRGRVRWWKVRGRVEVSRPGMPAVMTSPSPRLTYRTPLTRPQTRLLTHAHTQTAKHAFLRPLTSHSSTTQHPPAPP